MTAIVGFNLGTYVLIAADTRVSYYPNGRLVYRDDEKKIRKTSMGIIAGAGLADFLDTVKERLEQEQITHTDRILEIVREERQALNGKPWSRDTRVQEALKTTAWMFTYLGVDSLENPTPGSAKLRLAMTLPEENYKIAFVLPGNAWVFPPTPATREQQERWHRFAADNLQPLDDGSPLAPNITHHAAVATHLIREISGENAGVSPTLQIGLHFLPICTAISAILSDDNTECEWSWSGLPDDASAQSENS